MRAWAMKVVGVQGEGDPDLTVEMPVLACTLCKH